MRVHGIGVDVVEIDRIEEVLGRHGRRFLEKILTEEERAYCDLQADPLPHIAARFAAKEAVAKALGTGIGGDLGWLDMEVRRDPRGAPEMCLSGAGAAFARRMGIVEVKISLSHARTCAVAQAMALG
jgi:holo-[acyl-carrier protein] synthase